jgi:hypothetical protein
MKSQSFRDTIFFQFNGSQAYIERASDLLVGFALREHDANRALAISEGKNLRRRLSMTNAPTTSASYRR